MTSYDNVMAQERRFLQVGEPEPPWALDAWTLQVMMAADNVEQRQDVGRG